MTDRDSAISAQSPPQQIPGDQTARQEIAAQIRRDHPTWVVIWAERKGEYQARPLFRAAPPMVAATTPEELITRMGQARRLARTRRR